MDNTERLNEYIEKILSIFTLEEFLREKSLEDIKKYYIKNHIAYWLFHNTAGFIHMGISEGGVLKKEDLLKQSQIVEGYIKSTAAKNILEIGAGNGSNSLYLSKNNPQVNFLGIDLSHKEVHEGNYTQFVGNYNDLNQIGNESLDIVFAIETMCHSASKEITLLEVKKKLKTDGLLIIFDAYTLKREPNETERNAIKMTEKSMAVNNFLSLSDFVNLANKCGYTVIDEQDFSLNILPNLRKFENSAKRYFNYPFFARLLNNVLGKDITINSVAGLLMRPLVEMGIFGYYMHILKKN